MQVLDGDLAVPVLVSVAAGKILHDRAREQRRGPLLSQRLRARSPSKRVLQRIEGREDVRAAAVELLVGREVTLPLRRNRWRTSR